MIHTIECDEPWFSLVRNGTKPVEGRKNSPKFQAMNPGDTLVFVRGDQRFESTITGINHYKTVEDYLAAETLERALPGVPSIKDGVNIYLQWNTRDEIEQSGFLGIQVKVQRC